MKKLIKALSGLLKSKAVTTAVLIICLAAATIAASYYLQQMDNDAASARVEDRSQADTVITKKSLPCNRYYNEVLMY